jgi:prephenate dehydrogenase
MTNTKFNSVLIVGVGLIGSSLARAIKENDLAINIYGIDNNLNNLKKCEELKLLLRGESSLDNFSEQFDMIIICSPLSTYKKIFFNLNN